MKVLNHHVYEYRKGLRNLVLHTIPMSLKVWAEARLERDSIPYIVCPVSNRKINLFFGEKDCVDVIASFGSKKLNEFTPEETSSIMTEDKIPVKKNGGRESAGLMLCYALWI
ncbi:MAG: DUF2023 family protein [Candidatus Sabulitectum sp.]|nr:DUF2023 family protein [Candidatus Sabulitectum sp.]